MKEWDELLGRPSFYEGIAGDIQRHGRAVICVGGDKDEPPFAYTIGNSSVGLPELLILGTAKGAPLNALSDIMAKRKAAFADNELVDLGGRVPVKVITVTDLARARADYTVQAGEYFRHDDYAVQQVLMPDRSGRFPDEPGCRAPYATIPILRGQ